MHKTEDIGGAANTKVSSQNNSILFTENGESTVNLVHNINDIDGIANIIANSQNNSILLSETGKSAVQLEDNSEIDKSFNAKVISKNNSILLSKNIEMIEQEHDIEDIDGSTNANISPKNNSVLLKENGEIAQPKLETADIDGSSNVGSIFFTENRGSTVQLSMKSYCYTWTINNFFKCLNVCLLEQSADIHFKLNSPNFIFQDTEWCLHLNIVTVSEQSNSKVKEMNIVLESKSNIARDLFIKNVICIVDDDGKVILRCSPKKIAGIGNRKEYSYSFLPLRGTESFVLPYKLVVRNEFSTLISDICEDTGFSFRKCDNLNVGGSERCVKNDDASISLTSKCYTRHSVLSRLRWRSWLLLERVCTEVRKFLIPSLVVLFVSLIVDSLVGQNHDAISTFKSDEINDNLIFDYAKKLNLIAAALNLTAVKEKSLEILVLHSKMYNSTDSTDHVRPVMQLSMDSNVSRT